MQVKISEPNRDEQLRITNSTIDDITSASCLPDVKLVDSVLNKLFDTQRPRLNAFIPLYSEFSDIRRSMQMKPLSSR